MCDDVNYNYGLVLTPGRIMGLNASTLIESYRQIPVRATPTCIMWRSRVKGRTARRHESQGSTGRRRWFIRRVAGETATGAVSTPVPITTVDTSCPSSNILRLV